ncbi:tol-pal system protein YbgF [Phenylobacterium sp.]|jgi:tol-pal system protein YbgF|uniref:tol-pal system protein YbgF n=1 Tax=Phenylobacterium sp. TaxID=1871053 RepID=UPI002F939FC3
MSRFPLLRRLALPAAILAMAAAPVLAQTPMDDPLDARDARRVERMEKVVRELRDIVFKAQKTGAPVVVQPADTDARMLELSSRIADLEQTLRRINGSMETTAHELDLTKRENARLKEQLAGLTEKLAAAEQRVATLEKPPEPPPPPIEDAKPRTASEAFTEARGLMQAGDNAGAGAAFEAYLEQFPDGPRQAEARYWLGKTQTARRQHAQAASSYLASIRNWPQASWAPDAVVELARALIALKKPEDACQTLAELPKRYPKAPAAVNTRAKAAATQAKCAA